ncbi:hypothetical protein V6N13_034080 [Hibiscus sabdariffa]
MNFFGYVSLRRGVGRWLCLSGSRSRLGVLPQAGGGDDGVLGAEPKCESGVDCLLVRMAGGVDIVLGIEVWLGTGKTCGVAAEVEWAAVGADGPASSGAAAGEWAGVVGGVGIATLMGVASATSIFRMYSFSAVYMSPGWVGTVALQQRADMMHGKAKMPLSVCRVRPTVWLWEVGIRFLLTNVFHNLASGRRLGWLPEWGFLPVVFHFVPCSQRKSLIVS